MKGMDVPSAGGSSAPMSEGTKVAVCVGVVDLGTHHSDFYNKDKRQIAIMFEVPEERWTADGVDESRIITGIVGASLHEKATLRKWLEAWFEKKLKDGQRVEFKNLLSQPCQLSIVHKQVGDRTYSNIAAIMALPKAMKKSAPKLEREPWFFSLDDGDEPPVNLPEWMVTKIKDSAEYKKRRGTTAAAADAPADTADDEDEALPF